MFRKLSLSLSSKIIVYSIILSISFLVITFIIFYAYGKYSLKKGTEERLVQMSEVSHYKTQMVMQTIEKIPNNFQWWIADYVPEPDSMVRFSRRILESNPEILRCVIAYEPGHFPAKGECFGICSYLHNDSIYTKEITNHYLSHDCYTRAKNHLFSFWSDKSLDTKENEEKSLNYCLPLVNKRNEFIGVFIVTLSSDWISNVMIPTDNFEGCYPVIVDKTGKYIMSAKSYPLDIDTSLPEVAETMNDPHAVEIAQKIVSGEKGECFMNNRMLNAFVSYAPIAGTEWNLVLHFPYRTAFKDLVFFKKLVLMIFLILLILMCLVNYISISKLTKPLKSLVSSAQMISEGDLNVKLPSEKHEHEMKVIYNSLEYMQKKVKRYFEHLQQKESDHVKLEKDLSLAHNIQVGLLTKDFSFFERQEDVDFYAITYSAQKVGGDFYDFFVTGNNLYFIIGDVSGKGVAAALMMAVTISLFRSIPTKNATPAYIANFINHNICEYNEAELFVTLFIGSIDLETGVVKYCNLGHPAPLLIDRDTDEVVDMETFSDFPLGIDMKHVYMEYKYHLSENQGLLFYTDGVSEAQNCKKEFFGEQRLTSLVKLNKHLSSKELVDKIVDEIHQYKGACELSDDFTVLALFREKIKKVDRG